MVPVILIVLLLCTVGTSTRQKCGPYVLPSEDDPQLIYYQLVGNSTVQYVWGLKDTPTLYMTLSGHVDTCTPSESVNNSINWNTFPEYGSVNLTGDETFTIVFNQLIEFCDKDGKAYKVFNPQQLDNPHIYRNYSLGDFDWTFDKDRGVASGIDTMKLKWDITVNVPVSGGRLGYFPKTLYTENSTTFDFAFQNFTYKISNLPDGSYGRIVLDLLLIHNKNGTIESHFSKDDEYTPSIFLTYNYLFKFVNSMQGYVQWKPISYLSVERKSTKSEQVNAILSPETVPVLPSGLASALYESTSNIVQLYLVMGTEGDDNNFNPKYITWTGMMGFGVVPYDSISIVVIITIAVGLGIPLILVVLGGVYVFIKKKPWERFTNKGKGYAPVINEDK